MRKQIGQNHYKRSGYWARFLKRTTRQPKTAKQGRFTTKQQQDFLTLLADLLTNGFTLQESFSFMKKVLGKERSAIELMEKRLSRGIPLYVSFKRLGFSEMEVTQVNLAELHGDLLGTLIQVNQQTIQKNRQQTALKKTLSYPLLLLFFLVSLLLAMKFLLLPQLLSISGGQTQQNFGIWLIDRFPMLLVGAGISIFLVLLFFRWLQQKYSAIQMSSLLSRLPGYRRFYQARTTAFFAQEWGKLMKQGLELQTIILLMRQTETNPLMQEVAHLMSVQLAQGVSLANQIHRWPFFLPEFALIIQQGEAKGKLADELLVYSSRTQQQVIARMQQLMQWLQPLIFLGVALLIVAIYSAILLPIYGGMEDIL